MIDRKGFHHIYEYLELGYPYEEIEFMIEFIMKKLGLGATEKDTLKKGVIQRYSWARQISAGWLEGGIPDSSLCRYQGFCRWYFRKKYRKSGEYLYHCGKKLCGKEAEGIWKNTYRLYINEEEVLLQDVNRFSIND